MPNSIKRKYMRLKISCRKLIKRLARSRQFAVFVCILSLFALLITILSVYTPVIFNAEIIFETYEGSEVSSIKIPKGNRIKTLPKSELEYNTFEGWYFDEAFSKPYQGSKLNADTVLYAKFQTIFTEAYFRNRVDFINDLYDMDLDKDEVIISDYNRFRYYFEQEADEAFIQNNVKLLLEIDHHQLVMKSVVLNTKENATILMEKIIEHMEEYLLHSFYIIQKDVALFFMPIGMQFVFFNGLYEDEIYHYTTNNMEEYSIIRYKENDKNLVLPATFKGKPITSISALAFSNKDVESVVMPDTIKVLGFGAFFNTKITHIDLPEAMTTIYSGAFFGCNYIESIHIPANVSFIGYGAFIDSLSMKEITISPDNLHYESYKGALYDKNMTKLIYYPPHAAKDIIIPEGVEEIAPGAFYSTFIETVFLPQTLKNISEAAFQETKNLKSVTIPKSVKQIGESAFYGSGISFVSFAEGSNLKNLGKVAFAHCQNLLEITLPSSVETMGEHVFQNSINLKKVNLGSTAIKSLPKETFIGCTSLEEVVLPATIKTIASMAFYMCNSLEQIILPEGLLSIEERAFSHSGLKSIELPQSLKRIEDSVFEFTSIESLSLQNSLEYIGANIVFACDNLASLSLPLYSENANYENYFLGYYFGMSNYSIPSSLKNITITNNITELPAQAFEDCRYIESVELPDTIINIGYAAFKKCFKLKNINIPQNLIYISNEAFSYCMEINELSFPSTLEIIGDKAFAGDFNEKMSIQNIIFSGANNIKRIGSYAFAYNGLLEAFIFSQNLAFVGEYAFYYCSALKSAHLQSNNIEIGNGVFAECKLESLSAPMEEGSDDISPNFLGYYFRNNLSVNNYSVPSSLKTFTVLEGCEKIPENAFRSARYIETINLPSSINEIGAYAFANCLELGYINHISEIINKIGSYAFFDCQMLENFEITQSIKTIGEFAFKDCISLTAMDASNVENVGQGVFKGCSNLNELSVRLEDVYNQNSNSYLLYYLGDSSGAMNNYILMDSTLTTVNIYGTTKIPDYAFWGFEKLEHINVFSSITKIGREAFYRNSALKSFEFKEGLTDIDDKAFYQNESLTQIIFPRSLVNIGEFAFEGALLLQTVTFAQNSNLGSSIGQRAFAKCISLQLINIPDSIYEISAGLFMGCESLQTFVIPQYVQYIRQAAFEGSGIKSISLPRLVTEIDWFAFRNCKALETVVFEDLSELSRLRTIGRESFLGCESLTSIVFPSSLREIVGDTFKGCSNLKSVTVLREFNYRAVHWFDMATRLNDSGVFDDCHSDLKIYVPTNNSGVSDGVEKYKNWSKWSDYSDRIYPIVN